MTPWSRVATFKSGGKGNAREREREELATVKPLEAKKERGGGKRRKEPRQRHRPSVYPWT